MNDEQNMQPDDGQAQNQPLPVDNNIPEDGNKTESSDNTVLMAIVAYFIFFLPLLTEYKNNDFVKYHVKQSILILIVYVAIAIFGTIPFIGAIIAPIATMAAMVLWILGVVNAAGKKKEPLPLIGKYAEELFKF